MVVCAFLNVTKHYRTGFWMKAKPVLRDITFQVEQGETFAYLGHNGAGKTTSIKALLGLLRLDGGRITLFGQAGATRQARARIGYLPENPYFYEHLTGEEFLGLVADLHRLPHRQARSKVAEVLELVGLGRKGSTRLRGYSKGMLQRVGLAQALINDPQLLVLDEPMGGLDPSGRHQIRTILTELKERGTTLFLSSHILSDVEAIADRAAILREGQLRRIVRMSDLVSDSRSMEVHCRGLRSDAASALERKGLLVHSSSDVARVQVDDETDLPAVLVAVREGGARLLQVVPRRETLEDIFLREVQALEETSSDRVSVPHVTVSVPSRDIFGDHEEAKL